MAANFDLARFKTDDTVRDQYRRQLKRLAADGKSVECIETAVRDALANLDGPGRKSFIIYGEPQSGKTEMMICLTAKLLDEGRRLIIHLLNDSVDLLSQNLGRFKSSGLAPSAQNFTEILDPAISLKKGQHVVFCKKNSRDLQKLFNKTGKFSNVVIIDDEADYASPNAKVNKAERTAINNHITNLLGSSGDYIGVTATPARLDLNNTFDNDSKLWVHFPPHMHYTGQKVFFPFDEEEAAENEASFRLTLLPNRGDEPKHGRSALFSFLVNVAYLNILSNVTERNYSMLIHTSGKKVDHKTDWDTMQEALNALSDRNSSRFDKYIREIWSIAHDRYPDADSNEITFYVRDNISRNAVIILNSDSDFRANGASATNPSSLFTIVIGGNIVSRGVTFDNLLSMFFTRDVKHKIQQDTYIQRARMFGSRGKYLRSFELTIPEALYRDWHRCFVFHRLSLQSIDAGDGSPVWLSDSRIAAVSSNSIDRSTVDIDRGEMSFGLFKFSAKMDELAHAELDPSEKLKQLSKLTGERGFPSYIRRFILRTEPGKKPDVSLQQSGKVYPTMTEEEKASISRGKGMMGSSQSTALHSLKIFRNDQGTARLFYKYAGSIEFLKNMK